MAKKKAPKKIVKKDSPFQTLQFNLRELHDVKCLDSVAGPQLSLEGSDGTLLKATLIQKPDGTFRISYEPTVKMKRLLKQCGYELAVDKRRK